MKGKLLFIAIIILGCSEEHETKKKLCSPFRMTISDAIPVQFWVNGVETFNQKEVCGITSVCFCLPFQCDDEIRIQVQDSVFSSVELEILDSSSTTITSLSLTEVSSNIFELTFIPSEIDICDEQIRFKLNASGGLLNEEFISDISNWENFDSGTSWAFNNDGGDGSARSNTVGIVNSKYLRQLYSTKSTANGGLEFSVDFELNVTVSAAGTVYIKFYGFSGSTATELVQVLIPGAGVLTISDQSLALGDFDYIGFRLVTEGGEFTVNVHYVRFNYEELAANSDCIDIRTTHDCTTLIRYDNAKDFAGIEYSDFSPTAEFYIRIPAIFFHERNTEEEENFEESSENIVRLRNEIKLKRLLEVGFMPDYMHRKLLLILAHDTIEIDGESWIKRDPYEKEEPGNRRYPLKKASVLLTQKDYIKRNIL